MAILGGEARPPADRTIKTLDDVQAAIKHYVEAIPYEQLVSTAMGLSSDIEYRLPTDEEMVGALKRRAQAAQPSAIFTRPILRRLFFSPSKNTETTSCSNQPGGRAVPVRDGEPISQKTLAQLAQIIARHPKLRFQCFVSSRHANQTLCTLCRELPNFSLAGFWWHNFFPAAIRHVMAERLDMVPGE